MHSGCAGSSPPQQSCTTWVANQTFIFKYRQAITLVCVFVLLPINGRMIVAEKIRSNNGSVASYRRIRPQFDRCIFCLLFPPKTLTTVKQISSAIQLSPMIQLDTNLVYLGRGVTFKQFYWNREHDPQNPNANCCCGGWWCVVYEVLPPRAGRW